MSDRTEKKMPSDREVKDALQQLAVRTRLLEESARDIALGRQVRVISEFNGQMYGRSRKPLTGQTLKITGVFLYGEGRYSFITDDRRVDAGFGPEDVEFV